MNTSARDIIELFKTHGEIVYGEVMSVNSHSVQAGWLAKEKGLDQEIQVAAFLHDIGHIIPLLATEAEGERMGEFGMEQHDLIGADYLERVGFPAVVPACAKNHVNAKRYLCYREPGYFEQLSPASVETLRYQGGPMDADEATAFEQAPHFKASITVRRLDELAKEEAYSITAAHWQYFEERIAEILEANNGI